MATPDTGHDTGYDAVVVGAGPNGLVAANRLADAGWSVLLLEQQAEVGGAVRSDREVHPDFVHDTFSAFYPLAAASPAIRSFALEDHGLAGRHAPAVLGHPLPGRPLGDPAPRPPADRRWLDEAHAATASAGWTSAPTWDRIGDQSSAPCCRPSRRCAPGSAPWPGCAGRRPRLRPDAAHARPPTLGRERFGGDGPRLLLAGNAGHSDIPLDVTGVGPVGHPDGDDRARRWASRSPRVAPASSRRRWPGGSSRSAARSGATRRERDRRPAPAGPVGY